MNRTADKMVAIAGLGAIGAKVAEHLVKGIPGYRLVAVAERDETMARRRLASLGAEVPIVPLRDLAWSVDIVIECVGIGGFLEVAAPAIEASETFVPLTAVGLLEHPELIERARETGARILMPSGALLGFDAVRSAAEGTINEVRMRTRKPPHTLVGAPHVEANRIALENVTEPLCVFRGSAWEGAKGFPANVNVAAALSLAGIGPDRTALEIWADPTVSRNTHEIEVDADSTRFSMRIESIPSAENPRTGRFTPLSVVALLRGLNATLRIGS
jgi:aspartate dehydrogenase